MVEPITRKTMNKTNNKILVKFPTRQRPTQFVRALNACIENQTSTNVHYLITIDSDDESMKNVRDSLLHHDHVTVDEGKSYSKIHACNRGMDNDMEWDIVVLMSDDMMCKKKGWDSQLIKEMAYNYPDTDGVLWHNDGYTHNKLNTMCILGRKYYKRFSYIYNPEYKSFWCDNEFMDVASQMGKQTYMNDVLFRHEHPANTGDPMDAMYIQANNDYQKDKQTYNDRKHKGFAN